MKIGNPERCQHLSLALLSETVLSAVDGRQTAQAGKESRLKKKKKKNFLVSQRLCLEFCLHFTSGFTFPSFRSAAAAAAAVCGS